MLNLWLSIFLCPLCVCRWHFISYWLTWWRISAINLLSWCTKHCAREENDRGLTDFLHYFLTFLLLGFASGTLVESKSTSGGKGPAVILQFSPLLDAELWVIPCQVLKPSSDRGATASLHNMLQHLTSLMITFSFQYVNGISHASACLPLTLLLYTSEKSPALSLDLPSFSKFINVSWKHTRKKIQIFLWLFFFLKILHISLKL